MQNSSQNKYWLKFMWNLQNTKTIMYVGTFSISNICRYIFESADGISCQKWPQFSMLNLFVTQKLDAYH